MDPMDYSKNCPETTQQKRKTFALDGRRSTLTAQDDSKLFILLVNQIRLNDKSPTLVTLITVLEMKGLNITS